MALSEKYKWLQTIGTLPNLVVEGLKYLDLKEVPGAKSNPAILQMAKDLGVSSIYTNDDVSWCALFIAYLCVGAGKPMPFKSYEIIRAASFAKWGNPAGQAQLGDILVFTRTGGNHVGIYIAESANTYHVLGGNQSNAVTITEISKARLLAARRYYAIAPPASAKRYFINSSGNLSTNEQ